MLQNGSDNTNMFEGPVQGFQLAKVKPSKQLEAAYQSNSPHP